MSIDHYTVHAKVTTVDLALQPLAETEGTMDYTVDHGNGDNLAISTPPPVNKCKAYGPTIIGTTWHMGYCKNEDAFIMIDQDSKETAVKILKGGYYNWDWLDDDLETTAKHWGKFWGKPDGTGDVQFAHMRIGESCLILSINGDFSITSN